MFKSKEKDTLEFTEEQIRHSMNDEMLAKGNNMNIGTEHQDSDLGDSQRSGIVQDDPKPEVYMEMSDRFEQPDFASMSQFNRETIK